MSLPKTHFASEPPREAGSDDASTNAVERAWADRIRAGHMDAFEALYRTYWERLYAFAFRYLHSQQDAEDAVQEVFFRIWRGRAEWVPAGAVRRSEEHTSELQSLAYLVCRLLLEKKKN